MANVLFLVRKKKKTPLREHDLIWAEMGIVYCSAEKEAQPKPIVFDF